MCACVHNGGTADAPLHVRARSGAHVHMRSGAAASRKGVLHMSSCSRSIRSCVNGSVTVCAARHGTARCAWHDWCALDASVPIVTGACCATVQCDPWGTVRSLVQESPATLLCDTRESCPLSTVERALMCMRA